MIAGVRLFLGVCIETFGDFQRRLETFGDSALSRICNFALSF